jgi:hypothetical protein
MSTAGAFLALWNDFARGREAEYDAWHTREHVPERVSAPGFLSGRRYVNPAHPVHRWFTLYDVAHLGCFETPEYTDLLRNPTPASAAMRPGFRNFLRVPCEATGSAGFGIGGTLAVLRLPNVAVDLAGLTTWPGVVRARLGRRVNPGGTAGPFRAAALGSGVADDFAIVLLMETLDRAAATAALDETASRFGVSAAMAGGAYDLAFIFPGLDAGEREAHRRAGWTPLSS